MHSILKRHRYYYQKLQTLESLFAELEVQFEGCPLESEVADEVVEIDDLES